MKRKLSVIASAAGIAFAMAAAHAQDAAKLAKSSGCLNCHDVSKKKVGPSFKATAQKYPKQGDKIFAVFTKDPTHKDVIKDLSQDDLHTLANWIAGL